MCLLNQNPVQLQQHQPQLNQFLKLFALSYNHHNKHPEKRSHKSSTMIDHMSSNSFNTNQYPRTIGISRTFHSKEHKRH